jgi:hypothetical protein
MAGAGSCKKGGQENVGEKNKDLPAPFLIFLSHIFAVRSVKISLDIRMREYYFHSVLAQ